MAGGLLGIGMFAGIAAAGGVYVWARDLFASVREVASGECGEEAMRRAERALTIADVVVLAALADGRISPGELEVLERLRVESGRSTTYGTTEVVPSWEGARHAYASVEQAMKTIRAIAGPLTREERVLALRLVVEMQPDDAIEESEGGPYRGAVHDEVEIVPRVAEALDLEVADAS